MNELPPKSHKLEPANDNGRTESFNISVIGSLMHFIANLYENNFANFDTRQLIKKRKELTSASADELIQRVNLSDPTDWQKRPAYYRGLLVELKERGLLDELKRPTSS